MVVEHGRADVDEVHAGRLREHPAHAVRAEMVPQLRRVHAADHRLAPRHREAVGRHHGGQREGRRAHLPAARAMAGGGADRRLAQADAGPAAAARSVEGKRDGRHGRSPVDPPL